MKKTVLTILILMTSHSAKSDDSDSILDLFWANPLGQTQEQRLARTAYTTGEFSHMEINCNNTTNGYRICKTEYPFSYDGVYISIQQPNGQINQIMPEGANAHEDGVHYKHLSDIARKGRKR